MVRYRSLFEKYTWKVPIACAVARPMSRAIKGCMGLFMDQETPLRLTEPYVKIYRDVPSMRTRLTARSPLRFVNSKSA